MFHQQKKNQLKLHFTETENYYLCWNQMNLIMGLTAQYSTALLSNTILSFFFSLHFFFYTFSLKTHNFSYFSDWRNICLYHLRGWFGTASWRRMWLFMKQSIHRRDITPTGDIIVVPNHPLILYAGNFFRYWMRGLGFKLITLLALTD